MAREIFKNLPDTSTPINATKLNGVFNGEESMGSIVVEDITCKNLFDKDNIFTNRALNDGDGTVFEATNRNTTDFINVKPNSDYIFSNISRTAVCLYDNNKTFIKTLTTDLVTTTSDTYYLRFTYKTDEDYSEGQLEKGSVATDYVEHKEYENKDVYSTNEQVIGTWIDGKPLYRKVIDFGSLPNNAEKSYNIAGLNVNTIINVYGFAMTPEKTYGYSIPFNNPRGTIAEGVGIYKNQNYIVVITGIDRSDYNAYIVLEYTKTID